MDFKINTLILNNKIDCLKQSLLDAFHDEPYIYTALALKSMGLDDEQILDYLKDDIINHNELTNIKLEEFKIRNNIDNITNVSNGTSKSCD